MQGFQPEMQMRVNDDEEIGACLANNEEYTLIKTIRHQLGGQYLAATTDTDAKINYLLYLSSWSREPLRSRS